MSFHPGKRSVTRMHATKTECSTTHALYIANSHKPQILLNIFFALKGSKLFYSHLVEFPKAVPIQVRTNREQSLLVRSS